MGEGKSSTIPIESLGFKREKWTAIFKQGAG